MSDERWHWARGQIDFICPTCESEGGASQATLHLDPSAGWQIVCPSGCMAEAVVVAEWGDESTMFRWAFETMSKVTIEAAHRGRVDTIR